MTDKRPITLVIMDGYGLAKPSHGNAVENANTPVLDELYKSCPHTTLEASGENVGLPHGQMGNSEVGHTNIGAGRVVFQDLPRISNDIKSGKFFENHALNLACDNALKNGKALHLMGLVSSGGVHSHNTHLYGLLELAKKKGLTKVYIHCFMDGRDVPPDSGKNYIEELVAKCKEIGVGKIVSVMGRFYAMDRDNRWDRVNQAYNAMVLAEGVAQEDPVKAMQNSYDVKEFDEFVKPIVCDKEGSVKPNDSIIFFNFRPDRAREITRTFVDADFSGFERKNGFFPVTYICMTQYDETITGVEVAYPPDFPKETFGEIVSENGLTQLRIAETEKYAHVTFFFNGGVEEPFNGESRVLIPSPKEFPTYDLIPEMSAMKVAQAVVGEIEGGKHDVIIINFANCDMVGHTGVYDAAVKAVETVDTCVGMVKDAVEKVGGVLLITADHGNAEIMLADDGVSPFTAHSTSPVPFLVRGLGELSLKSGKLADISPTMLHILGIEQPKVMTGESLITSNS